jgi:copper resistance protein B
MKASSRRLKYTLLLACLPAVQGSTQGSHAGHDMSSMDHSAMDHSQVNHSPSPSVDEAPPPGMALVTDADRAAAFPDLGGMGMKAHMDDDPVNYMIRFDRIELQKGETPLVWDAKAWVGKDLNRLYLRGDGEVQDSTTRSATVEAFWARPVSRWWNLVAGIRQDFRPEPSRSWLAVGAVGLAPYRFNVEATAYLGDEGRTALRFETEYDLLLTNRLILQPRLELNAYGRDDRAREIGSGIASAEAGLRLRYEIRRELAPYAGLAWTKTFGSTADLAHAAGRASRELRAVVGIRIWF